MLSYNNFTTNYTSTNATIQYQISIRNLLFQSTYSYPVCVMIDEYLKLDELQQHNTVRILLDIYGSAYCPYYRLTNDHELYTAFQLECPEYGKQCIDCIYNYIPMIFKCKHCDIVFFYHPQTIYKELQVCFMVERPHMQYNNEKFMLVSLMVPKYASHTIYITQEPKLAKILSTCFHCFFQEKFPYFEQCNTCGTYYCKKHKPSNFKKIRSFK